MPTDFFEVPLEFYHEFLGFFIEITKKDNYQDNCLERIFRRKKRKKTSSWMNPRRNLEELDIASLGVVLIGPFGGITGGTLRGIPEGLPRGISRRQKNFWKIRGSLQMKFPEEFSEVLLEEFSKDRE